MSSGVNNIKTNKTTAIETIVGKVSGQNNIVAKTTAGGGTTDHSRLYNRDATDAHPISAITGLESALNSKLDSETALPLIEDAVKNKAKGLYYDAAKELASKPYWYLTSEIDSTTGLGTKASVISGPYNLGAGGGGSTDITTVTLSKTDPITGNSLWPTTVALGAPCKVGIYWTSRRDTESTGNGTIYLYINDVLFKKQTVAQGLVEFDIQEQIIAGANKIEFKITDAYSTTKNLIGNISGVTLKLTSSFEDDNNYSGDIVFSYVPYGDIEKTVYFEIDEKNIGIAAVKTSGEQCTYLIKALPHGAHVLKVYFTAVLDGETVTSNILKYDLITYTAGNTTPIIASTNDSNLTQEQYVPLSIKYRVFTPGFNISTIQLLVDGQQSGSDLTVDSTWQNWEYQPTVLGEHILSINTGNTQRSFNLIVTESTIKVEAVTQSQVLYLTTLGRSNSESIEKRQQWEDEENNINCTLTGFNWSSNGWLSDEQGNTVLRLSGDARATIPYKVFENDFQQLGKTIEIELATKDVKQYESRIVECLTGGDSLTYSYSLAGEDDREKYFEVESVDNQIFINKILNEHASYLFIYSNNNWTLNGNTVSLADYGITLIERERAGGTPSDYIIDGDRITVSYLVTGRGFYITPQLAKFQSQLSTLSTQYKENEIVRLSFVIEKRTENRLIYMYINGIMSGVTRYPIGDTFIQSPPADIILGSNDATLDIYTIRIYNNSLTKKQIVNNWIADTRNIVLKADRYHDNDNYDDTGRLVISKLQSKTPYIILTGENLPSYKKDKRLVDVEFVYPGSDERYFTSASANADVQGTSSQYYYRKNFKIKFDNGFYDANGNYEKKYKIVPPLAKKEKTFTFKADVASSEGANNVELVKYFEDTKNFYVPPELDQDPDDTADGYSTADRVRVGIDGFPIVMFHNNGQETSFYGKMNFNNDKGNDSTFGFDTGDECWEITNNNNALVLFQNDDMNIWQESFESRYPESVENPDGTEHDYGTQSGELDKLTNVVKWVVSTRRLDTDTEEQKQEKLNKFKNELKNYFDVNSSLFYYLFTELFLMVDSRAKNAMLCYYKSRTANDGGNKWYWIPYDMDTAIGTNNEGLLLFDYDIEDTDIVNGTAVYNGQYSTFWNNIRDAFKDELKNMYTDLRSGNTAGLGGKVVWSYNEIEKRFENHQATWSANIFNEDSYTKYLEPLIKNNDSSYLGMAQGAKAEQRKWWLYNRFKYLDSKYMAGDAKANTIMLRAYQKSNFKITPYINCYLTAVFDQDTAGNIIGPLAAIHDEAIDITAPEHWDPAGTDSVVVLYSADVLRDIGDISGFKAGYADFSNATKLQRLQIGSSDSLYKNEKLTGINVGNNHLLTYIDARNCTSLGEGDGAEVTGIIDLSNCYSIEEAYFDNTRIKGVSLPIGGNLKVLHLPETITDLTIRSHPNLTDLSLASLTAGATNNLTSIWLEDIPTKALNIVKLISTMPAGSLVRVININETVESVDILKTFYKKLDSMHGKDIKGDTVEKAQITGQLYISKIGYADYIELSNKYPEVKIVAGQIICTVNFWNDETLYNTQSIILGGSAKMPGIPVKESTKKYYYTFTGWDKAYTNVETNLDIYAQFETHIQVYRATFDTQSPLIVATPAYEDVEYGNTINKPICTELPDVTLLGWYNSVDDTEWNFTTDLLLDNITLKAKWLDAGYPTVNLERKTFDTFTYTCTDNVGIEAWQITNVNEQPSEWNNIVPTTPLIGDYQISAAGDYYFWIKDAQNNISSAKIIANKIALNKTDGFKICNIAENNNIISSFALRGTTLEVQATMDTHYKDMILSLDGAAIDSGTTFIVTGDHIINANCTPKTYKLSFNMNWPPKDYTPQLETVPEQEQDQEVIYKTTAIVPRDQYCQGHVIEGWYQSYLDDKFSDKWDFNTSVILEDTILYARWETYTEPTELIIEVPTDSYNITLNFEQTTANGCIVDWGDNTNTETSDTLKVQLTHSYELAGGYSIKITCHNATCYLGLNFDTQVITPIEILKDVNFAWDITTTNTYAFKGATGLTEITLTSFMTSLNAGTFMDCTNLTKINMPINILTFGANVFQNCTALTGELKLPSKLISIGDQGFYGCSSITSIILPDTLTSLGVGCFSNCTALTEISSLPPLLQAINNNLFAGCSNLTKIEIPESVTTIGFGAFRDCINLEKLIYHSKKLNFDQNGYVYYNCKKLKSCGPIDGDYNIEFAFDTEIPDYAFMETWDSSNISVITLPSTITKIGKRAFMYTSIEGIDFNENLTYIDESVFNSCSRLKTLTIPKTVTYIGANMAYGCKALLEFNLFAIGIEESCKVTTLDLNWIRGATANLIIHVMDGLNEIDCINYYGQYWCYRTSTDVYTVKADLI